MKAIILLFLGGLLLFGCARQATPVSERPQEENIVIKNGGEEEEYELIIIDPEFHGWFASYAKPVHFYSESYYESHNIRYAASWNELYYATNGLGPFGNLIDYSAAEDYGLELNYKLFWYFKYVESKYGSFYNFPS